METPQNSQEITERIKKIQSAVRAKATVASDDPNQQMWDDWGDWNIRNWGDWSYNANEAL